MVARAWRTAAALGAALATGCTLDWEQFKPRDATASPADATVPGDGQGDAPDGHDGGCTTAFVVPDAACMEGVLPDPSFEADADTWARYENVRIERLPAPCAPEGERVLRVTDLVNSESEWGATVVGPTTTMEGQRYALSAWVRAAPGSPRITNAVFVLLNRQIPTDGGPLQRCGTMSYPSSGVLTLEPGVWTLARIPASPGTLGCRMDVTVVVRRSGAPPGAAIEIDDVDLCRVP